PRWNEGSDSDHVPGLNRDNSLVGHRKIPAEQWAKLPRYGREGAVEVRPFTAEKRLCVSEAQGLSGEAVKGNPTTTVIPRVDESKPSHRTTEDLTEPSRGLADGAFHFHLDKPVEFYRVLHRQDPGEGFH